MTELDYLRDMPSAYLRSFRARVTALPPGAVVLDRTLFYPAGGGQPCDRGSLALSDGTLVPIVDVVKSGGSVLHRVGRGPGAKSPLLRVGAEVEGTIDWERRHRHMRLHTAQHLVSAILFADAGLKTRKATLNGTRGSIELEAPWPADRPWTTVTERVDAYTSTPHEVRIVQVPRAKWDVAPSARAGLVPLPVGVDPVRVVEIDGIDQCPCGGTHVRSTGEIGPIQLPPPKEGHIELEVSERGPTTPAE